MMDLIGKRIVWVISKGKYLRVIFVVILILLLNAVPDAAGQDFNAPALPMLGGSFFDDFELFDVLTWHKADGWTNGSVFNCGWRADHAFIEDGHLKLRLDDQPCPLGCSDKPYASGEYRSNQFYDYGLFEVRLKAVSSDGVVTSFFLYTDSIYGSPHDEIDIEILGKDTTQMQINYWTNAVGGHEVMIDLGFDAAGGFHTYGIDWQPDSIRWLVDGVEVHVEDGSNGELPSHPARIMMNLWPGIGVDDWLNPFVYSGPLIALYDWVRYTAADNIFLPILMR